MTAEGMTASAPVGVGLLGMGVVGSGVAKALLERSADIAGHVGAPVVLRRVLVRDAGRPRDIALPAGLLTTDPEAAVAGARCVVTDTWVSMADDPATNRHNLLTPYRVTEALMKKAAPDAIFMHCLPAHRGEEMTAEVIDGPQSVVWDEAENRLHVQKAIVAWLAS